MSHKIVSIHASTREATSSPVSSWITRSCFNPRLHAGGDLVKSGQVGAVIAVSIHASTREATAEDLGLLEEVQVSIHASTREATLTV